MSKTEGKSFRFAAEAAEALEKLAAAEGRSQTATLERLILERAERLSLESLQAQVAELRERVGKLERGEHPPGTVLLL